MRKALAALVITAVAVVLLASYETKPPTTFNPNSALRRPAERTPAAAAVATWTPQPHPPGTLTGRGPLITTPFSAIQVQAWVHEGRLVDVRTLSLTGSDAHTKALNKRAEPILRREALKAGNADVDAVTGATYTSESWSGSLAAAIEAARVD